MPDWVPGLKRVIDKGFGGSRNGQPINGAVVHHGAGTNVLGYVANANSRNSHPTYHVATNGDATGIVHPNRRPFSTGGRPDSEAITFELDNSAVGGSWPVSNQAISKMIDIIVWHYLQSPRRGHGIAKNIPGQVQKQFFIAWHSQYKATACPGPHVLGMMDYIVAEANRRAEAILNPKPPVLYPPIAEVSKQVGVTKSVKAFGTAAAARAGTPVRATYEPGNYWVYKVDKNDVVNISKVQGKPGGWVMAKDAGLTLPTPEPVLWNVVFDDSPTDPASDYLKVVVKDGEKVVKPASDPTRDGFIFAGWFVAGKPYDFNAPVKGLLTIEAMWEAVVVPEPEPEPEPEVPSEPEVPTEPEVPSQPDQPKPNIPVAVGGLIAIILGVLFSIFGR